VCLYFLSRARPWYEALHSPHIARIALRPTPPTEVYTATSLYQTGIVAGSEATSADRTGEKTLGERGSANVMTLNASGDGEYNSEAVAADCRDDGTGKRSTCALHQLHVTVGLDLCFTILNGNNVQQILHAFLFVIQDLSVIAGIGGDWVLKIPP
jgi:hypothetical protein